MKPRDIFFNAMHAPIGAHATFTLGCPGAKGGLGLERGGPANESVYIGVETRAGGSYEALPFFGGADDESKRYDHSGGDAGGAGLVRPFPASKITRDFNLATDTWAAGDLTFTVHSPVMPVPDPAKAKRAEMQFALCPAVLATLTIDNTKGSKPRKAFFGYVGGGSADSMWQIDENAKGRFAGIAKGLGTAILSTDKGLYSAQGFTIEDLLALEHPENRWFGLGATAALIVEVPARKKATYTFAITFHRAGIVTMGLDTRYFYTRYFKTITDAGLYALQHATAYKQAAKKADARANSRSLTNDQRFQLIHAVRSYYGSTQFLDCKGKPFWVVNEGEYRMMNTFDLTVDQLFFEMEMNPWTVRNELDMFTHRYQYTDKVHFPGGENLHPGGISFTHDMGMGNHISRPGYSTYEKFGLTGCFSHMTHEQLVNWVLCAAVYAHGTQDVAWVRKNLPVFRKCLRSMVNRDHPKDAQRNGIMGLDSSRTLHGAEITTYDSLDESLGQARNNVYMAVKCWAAYLAMEELFQANQRTADAALCAKQARRCADTIVSHQTPAGDIPAILGEGSESRIIPAVEGLVFPHVLGMRQVLKETGPFGALIRVLKTHLQTVLVKGVCLYPDGAWKLSSTADNSWLSKIYLCQFVARKILGMKNPVTRETADEAHVRWLLHPENVYFAWSDQMVSGVARGSKYYPRGVTNILWLSE